MIMENRFLNKLDKIIVVNIKSRNIDRLLKNIYNLNISIYKLVRINYKEINITIKENDLDKIRNLSVLNEVSVIDYKGKMKAINKMKINRSFIFSIIIGVILLILLSNMIFTIEVSHTDNYLKELVLKELNKYGIKEYRFKKSFDELTDIKNKILEDNKKIIEWLEIEVSGTKYIVKIEERKINNKKEDNTYQDIISTRDAVIKNIVASNGVVVCDINDYVKKGDTLISGSIYLNDTLKGYTKAEGKVYGEVWYTISIEYPVLDVITSETGNKKTLYSINFFNKSITLGKKYKNSSKKREYIFKNNILPISITKDIFYETEKIDGIYSEGEVLLNARSYARSKIKEKIHSDEHIISEKLLKYRVNSNTIYMEVFYKVYANITGEKKIIIEE